MEVCSLKDGAGSLNPPLDNNLITPRVYYLDRPLPVSYRITELSQPKKVRKAKSSCSRNLPIPISKKTLNYDATERIKSLAVPKNMGKYSNDPCSRNAFYVSETALKYRASPRIAQLAAPLQTRCTKGKKCRKAFEITKAVLNYKATGRINNLANPRKSRALKPRKLPIKVSEKAKNYIPSERILNLAIPIDKEKNKLKALKNMMRAVHPKDDRSPDFYKSTKIKKKTLNYEATDRIKELSKPCRICPCSGKCLPERVPPIRALKYKPTKRIKNLARPVKRKAHKKHVNTLVSSSHQSDIHPVSYTSSVSQETMKKSELGSREEHINLLSAPRKIEGHHQDLPLPRPVPSSALSYEATWQIKKLATPKGRPVPKTPPPTPTPSEELATKYNMTKRIANLALPRQRADPNQVRHQSGVVSPSALKYKATPRIMELANPREHGSQRERKLPMRPTKAALEADASSRVLYLALPKRRFIA